MTSLQHALARATDRIQTARAERTPLCLRGGGSKDFLGRAPGAVLDTRDLCGITSYEPTELVVTVGCGTPLAELEAALAEQGQCLPFEPPHYRWSQAGVDTHAGTGAGAGGARGGSTATVGGMLACGLAGPARASVGGVRDYVLGMTLINGLGQTLTFGGQVMKNVAGYDVSRLMVGARGSLGLLTEVSLKVLPRAPAEATLCFALQQHEALEQLHRWGGQPLPLNASCWVMDDGGPRLYVRLRGAEAAVEAACRKMLAEVAGQRLDKAQSEPDWARCRDHGLPFFTQRPTPDALLWRLSLPQTAPVLALPSPPLVEWHGALRWLWAPASAAPALQAAAAQVGGSAGLFWAGAPGPAPVRGDSADHRPCCPSEPALAAISRRLQASFDPEGVFNSGARPDANPPRP